MARYVVSDASPLIGLAIVDGLGWLPALFGTVWIPASVQREVLPGVGARGEREVAAAIKAKGLRVWRKAPSAAAVDLGDLDEGETDCIRIALSEGAAQVLLLMDERAGRAIAQELGIPVAGTAAVIGLAKKRGLIPSARASFERLHGSDFRISAAVIQAVLREVGEL
jgi:predicted nucleic acid-binding protein